MDLLSQRSGITFLLRRDGGLIVCPIVLGTIEFLASAEKKALGKKNGYNGGLVRSLHGLVALSLKRKEVNAAERYYSQVTRELCYSGVTLLTSLLYVRGGRSGIATRVSQSGSILASSAALGKREFVRAAAPRSGEPRVPAAVALESADLAISDGASLSGCKNGR